ncbi:TIGR03087 family PEP-CTERM/XrtA system glycosyltransferase [uncultured Erythrobacter sp.]|uniref:TIGR03087 family PEP-CTERM/XrtA system glycosyltransferase n=1 Tax=uncultured Erythrobacter sp. TaxID=263913 RepID=UPI002607384A|nr:TIGR03087 family PEP-CTERM/XrtA system glycosyltransferase [uncultured Erythrobacter sp.]
MGDILFLAHRVPFPPNRGDKIRAHHLLKKLARIAPVHAGCVAESEEDRAGKEELDAITATHCIADRNKPLALAGVEALLKQRPVSLTAFDSPRLRSWVRETIAAHNVTTIVIFSGQMGQYVPDHFDGRVVIDLCDVDSAKFENYAAAGQRAWINAREGRLLAQEEERLARRADATVLISENEAALFRSRLSAPALVNVQVIGNGIDAAFFDPAKSQPHTELTPTTGPHFVFTGQMDYSPNEEAALWVAREFMPRMRQLEPQARFHIVGRNPTKSLLACDGTNGVKVWGEVADVRPFIAGASAVLAPLQIARGVQNKVLEAMAMARPVILSPQAATGINAKDGEDWLLCENDAQLMAERAAGLLQDKDAMFDLGSRARQFVLDHHDWDAMLSPLDSLLDAEAWEAQNVA